MVKTIMVDLTLGEHGAGAFFLEPESGDSIRIEQSAKTEQQFVEAMGWELYSWFPLMADEIAEQEDEQNGI